MGRIAGRTPADTRRVILNATATVVRTHGTGATIDDIARHAGVSKGGLFYHFTNKEELLTALATELFEQFRASVHAEIDPSDPGPGALTRAYVRACLRLPADESATHTFALISQLMTIPAVAALAHRQSGALQEELAADGLATDIQAVVIAAADGASTAPLWGSILPELQRRALEHRLIALTTADTAQSAPGMH